jgi:hypothetical protein
LAWPPGAEAQRGRPGDIAAPSPGVPGALPAGLPMFNRAAGAPAGLRPQPGLPQQLPLPGMPIQPEGVSPEPQDSNDHNGAPTR